ncbi:MAG: hypothetical protein CW341_10380 [Bacteroidetes bacterium]|nr:hypothetical protein [Bacteroidota bacterium]
MTEWKEYKLGELTIDGKGSYGIAAPAVDFNSDKYTYLRITDINDDGTLNKNGLKSVDDKNSHKYLLRQNDIVFARTGASVGRSYFYDERDGELVYAGFLIKYSIDPTKVNPKILKFYTHSQAYYDWIQTVDNGATRGNINAQTYASMPIILPERHEQDRIASILSSLDDKIDLLRRENATLEQMAETLFRQWFVVETKEEWEEGNVVDFAKHCKDSINPQKHPNTVFHHYSIPAFDEGKKPTTETGESIQSNKYFVPTNCILFSKLNPHKDKRVWLMLDDVPDNAICSTEFQIVKPTNPEYLYFLYGWLTNKENYDEIASGVGGTSGSHQRIDPKSIFSFSCLNVDIETIRNYNNKVEPLFYKIRNNQKQIQTLIQTRDGLLPKLMSNEIKL